MLIAPASKLQPRKCSHLKTRNMPLVTVSTKLGLNDLANDTQDTCADQRQKAVIKSLFICLSCGFPFPIVHQVLSPPLSLAEWRGQQPLLVSVLCRSKATLSPAWQAKEATVSHEGPEQCEMKYAAPTFQI